MDVHMDVYGCNLYECTYLDLLSTLIPNFASSTSENVQIFYKLSQESFLFIYSPNIGIMYYALYMC